MTIFQLKDLVIVDKLYAFPNLSNFPRTFVATGGHCDPPSLLTLRDVLLLTSVR